MLRSLNRVVSIFIEPQRFEHSVVRAATWVASSSVGVFFLRLAAEISRFRIVPLPSRVRRYLELIRDRSQVQERTQHLFTRATNSNSPTVEEPKQVESNLQANLNDLLKKPKSAKRRELLKDDLLKGNPSKLGKLLTFYTLDKLLITCRSDLGLIKLALEEPKALKIIHSFLVKRVKYKETGGPISPELQSLKDEACFRNWLQDQYTKGVQNYKEILLDEYPHSLLECDEFVNEFPYLNECDCKTINSSIRTNLEVKVIEKVIEKFPHLKNSPLTIVSVGGGGGFQDLIYLAKLSKAGYNHLRLVTIDKDVKTEKALQDLKKFKETYLPELNLEIEQYRDLSSLKGLEPQVILMIDIAGEGSFLKDSYSFIKEEGMLTNTILGYTNWVDASRGLQTDFCETY